MVYFQPKLPISGKLECLEIKYAGKLYAHLVYFTAILYIFSSFGMLCQEKSGIPG
jgi:hypothetical protein